MIDLIQSEFRKIVLNCINKYAKDNTLSPDNVQLMLGLNEKGNTYQIMVDYAKKADYDIMQVLGVRIDFLGYSRLAPPFIMKSLVRFAERLKKSDEELKFDVEVMCVKDVNEKGKEIINLFLYKGGQYVETIEFEDLFNEEDMLDVPQM
tara:strand:- start:515 stop:961 length:447 start_codon:yes stop_codon:yes gene_type:complete